MFNDKNTRESITEKHYECGLAKSFNYSNLDLFESVCSKEQRCKKCKAKCFGVYKTFGLTSTSLIKKYFHEVLFSSTFIFQNQWGWYDKMCVLSCSS